MLEAELVERVFIKFLQVLKFIFLLHFVLQRETCYFTAFVWRSGAKDSELCPLDREPIIPKTKPVAVKETVWGC